MLVRVAALLILALAGAASLADAHAQAAPAQPAMIWCHDPASSTVSRKWPADCRGKIVTDAEAKQIQDERIRRTQRAIQGRKPLYEGRRLAGTGSAFIVAQTGHLLTNNHVIDGCAAVSVTPALDDAAIPASVVAADAALDLALVKAAVPLRAIASFREKEAPPASDVAVVGYPLHGKVAIKPIFVEGIVDAAGRLASPDRFILSIDIRHGNSGGPVFDRNGDIAGVVVAKVNTPAVYAKTGQVMRDVGIAIRLPVAVNFLRRNGVTPLLDGTGKDLADDALFDRARKLVAQVGCWK